MTVILDWVNGNRETIIEDSFYPTIALTRSSLWNRLIQIRKLKVEYRQNVSLVEALEILYSEIEYQNPASTGISKRQRTID
jgi:hypothetical protein